ncbi:TonB-dependent receptor [Pedobacter nototheniae]|uniref:TonB-dependent receptor n=1 Tax=Pedobacter nototheniae TaxID=2488994 RepID=UPI00292E78C6|nr:TonB-dependent receptor [Pedobacter nototheniae]
MKLTLILLMIVLTQVSAKVFSQKISLNEKNTPLYKTLESIRKQSGFLVLYQDQVMQKANPVTIDKKNLSLKEALDYCFLNQPLTYEILEQTIIVKYAPALEKKINPVVAKLGIDVKGKIIDETNKPLPGASIKVKGTNSSTASNLNGEFSLKNVPEDAILVVSFLGYTTKEIPVKENLGTIQLIAANASLNDVVVVGYGTQKRLNVTGSISQVKGTELAKAPVANITNSLVGRLPGLRAIQNSGEPGRDASTIDIRGFGAALVIVDGVPSDFSQIDANEIESFSILKDASAAVYGVRAANGVILVTTKKGTIGKPRINYTAYYGLQNNATKYPELADAATFAELSNEGAVNAWVKQNNPAAALSLPFTKEQVDQYKNGSLPSSDWFNSTIRKNAPQYYQNLNVDGGTEDVKYFFNLGYLNQDAIWKSNSTNFTRYNVRSNISAKINKRLTAELNLSARLEDLKTPGVSSAIIMSTVKRESPVFPIYANDNQDYLAPSNVQQNSLAQTNDKISGYGSERNKFFSGIARLTYDLPWVDGLSAKATYSYQNTDKAIKNYVKRYNLYKYNTSTKTYDVDYTANDPSNLSVRNNHSDDQALQLSLNYAKKFGDKHNVSGLLLFERTQTNTSFLSAYKEFLLDNLDELFAGVSNNQSNDGSSAQIAREGYVGKFNYDYAGKYLIELGFRYDGTYKVAPENRFGFFPNVSVGWRINEENFLKNNTTIDNLKLRASFGKVGDDGGDDPDAANYIIPFRYIPGYNYPSDNYIFGTQLIPGLITSGLTNPLLTWYTSYTANLGVDVSLWKGLLSGSFDVFYRKRTGLLATRVLSLPNTFGASLPQENLNGDNTRGFELELTHKNKIGEWNYSISPNLTFTRSKNGYLEQSPQTSSLGNYQGNMTDRWINISRGYVAMGQFQSQQEINTAPVQDTQGNKTLLPGDIRYQDLNGDGVIDSRDQTVIGRGTTPEIFFGLNLGVNYKGFDLSVLLQGASNFNRYYSEELQNPFFNNANTLSMFTDRWHRQDLYNPNSPWIPGKYPSTIISGSPNNQLNSTFWLQDATYLRVKNIDFGYTFPKDLIEKIGMRTARVYISGQNVLTFSKVNFIDPEQPSGRGNFYPQQKLWSLGLNVGF